MPEMLQENVLRRPVPALRGTVARYNGFRYAGATGGVHHGLPSRYLTVVISTGPPIEFVDRPGSAVAPGTYQCLVGGMHSRPALMQDGGEGRGMMLQVPPLGARRLFGVPAGALAGQVVDLREVWGPAASELVDRVASARSWADRFAAVDEVLCRVVADGVGGAPEVGRAWSRLVGTGGTVGVDEVAGEVGWSRRHLSARFQQEIGLGVKEAARVLRFERASTLLEQQAGPPGRAGLAGAAAGLAGVAAASGYYDQAHMANEWRALAGMSVREWLALELRDPPVDGVVS